MCVAFRLVGGQEDREDAAASSRSSAASYAENTVALSDRLFHEREPKTRAGKSLGGEEGLSYLRQVLRRYPAAIVGDGHS